MKVKSAAPAAVKSAVAIPRHQRVQFRKEIRKGIAKLRVMGLAATGYILAVERQNGTFAALFGSETKFGKMGEAVAHGLRKFGQKASRVSA